MSTEEIYNYRRVNDRISTGGQPTEEQLRSADAEGFTTVINLATFNPGHSVADEAGLVRSLDMMYHHIPVAWENPQESDFAAFEAVRQKHSGDKTLIHCATTNGEPLDRFSMEEIKQSGVDRIVISLNAYSKEMYEKINVGLDFDRVMKNVATLLADRTLRPKVEISFRLTQDNQAEVKSAVSYWKTQGVRIRVMGITNRAGSLANYDPARLKNASQAIPRHKRIWSNAMSGLRGVWAARSHFIKWIYSSMERRLCAVRTGIEP